MIGYIWSVSTVIIAGRNTTYTSATPGFGSGGMLHKVGVWFSLFITCEFALSIYLRV